MSIASIAGSGIKSLFTGIVSRDTAVLAVSSTHLNYSFVFFYLFIYFFVTANIFFFKSITWNLLSRIPYSVSVSVIPYPFPDSGFRIPDSGFRIPRFSAARVAGAWK